MGVYAIILCIVLVISLSITLLSLNRRRPSVSRAESADQLQAKGASPAVAHYLEQDDDIQAIKAYRKEHHVGLREATAAIKALKTRTS